MSLNAHQCGRREPCFAPLRVEFQYSGNRAYIVLLLCTGSRPIPRNPSVSLFFVRLINNRVGYDCLKLHGRSLSYNTIARTVSPMPNIGHTRRGHGINSPKVALDANRIRAGSIILSDD